MAGGNTALQIMHVNSKGSVVVSMSWGEDGVEEMAIVVVEQGKSAALCSDSYT